MMMANKNAKKHGVIQKNKKKNKRPQTGRTESGLSNVRSEDGTCVVCDAWSAWSAQGLQARVRTHWEDPLLVLILALALERA